MKHADISRVRNIDATAFSMKENVKRKRTNIVAALHYPAQGSFVLQTPQIVGYVFTRIWGSIGWIGPLGVHPHKQGKGYGKKLLTHAVSFLEKHKCTTIGLETMSDSPYNVGLYANQGFRLTIPTVILQKQVKKPGTLSNDQKYQPPIFTCSHEALTTISSLSTTVLKGLDYTWEVENALTYNWGALFMVGKDRPQGFSLIRTSPKLTQTPESTLNTEILLTSTKSKCVFHTLLQNIEAFAKKHDYTQVTIPANGVNTNAITWLLKRNYNVKSIKLRMIYTGRYANLNGIDLSAWLM